MKLEPQHWLLAGIGIGIAADFFSRWIFERVFGPKIRIPKEDKDVWQAVITNAELAFFETPFPNSKWYFAESPIPRVPSHRLDYRNEEVRAYRLKVKNEGRHAAENVAGTITFDTGERRICWYEGNVATITLNAKDHSFLDVFGIVTHASDRRICMPTEHGWQKLYSWELKDKVNVSLRVTTKNATPHLVNFEIDPAEFNKPDYKPRWLD